MKTSVLVVSFAVLCLRLPGAETWKVNVEYENQIFPSFVIATSAINTARIAKSDSVLGDIKGIIWIDYVPTVPNTKVEVDISGGELIKAGHLEDVAAVPHKRYRIYPKIAYDYRKLGQLLPAYQ